MPSKELKVSYSMRVWVENKPIEYIKCRTISRSLEAARFGWDFSNRSKIDRFLGSTAAKTLVKSQRGTIIMT